MVINVLVGQRSLLAAIILPFIAVLIAWWAWKSATKRQAAGWLAGTLGILMASAYFLNDTLPSNALKGGNPAVVKREGNLLLISGWIDDSMVRGVVWETIGKRPVEQVLLRSPGGVKERADDIVEVLARFSPIMVVKDDSFCLSSCVRIFSGSGEMKVSGGGVLGFHAGRYSSGIQLEQPRASVMSQWATSISPALNSYMMTCKTNPFTIAKMFYITLDDIEKISLNQPTRVCDDQTKLQPASILANDPPKFEK